MAGESYALHTPSTAVPLPAGWVWKRLDAVCEGVFDCPHSTPLLTKEGPYIARSQDIRSGIFRIEEAARVSEGTYRDRVSRAEPRQGDLLYSREGTYFGIAAEVPPGVRVCLGQRMVLLRPDPACVDARFLRYWLNSPCMALHIGGHRDGTVAERLNLPTIRGLPVAQPPLAEQRSAAYILGTLDDKIELNRRMSETLEAMARTVFKSWFVDFDPVRANAEGRDPGLSKAIADLFPARLIDSEFGKIPERWEVVRLAELIETVKGRSYRSDELVDSDTALVTLKSFARGGGYRPDGLKSFAGTYKANQVVKTGELVIACTDVTQAAEVIGRPAMVRASPSFRTLVASLDTLIVRPKGDIPGSSFLYCLARTEAFVAHTYAQTSGTTVLHLAKDAVPSFQFVHPSRKILEIFEQFARKLLERIQASELEADSLAALRDALLPKLISGELRVENAERLVERAF